MHYKCKTSYLGTLCRTMHMYTIKALICIVYYNIYIYTQYEAMLKGYTGTIWYGGLQLNTYIANPHPGMGEPMCLTYKGSLNITQRTKAPNSS